MLAKIYQTKPKIKMSRRWTKIFIKNTYKTNYPKADSLQKSDKI